jgi:hypothetical protein
VTILSRDGERLKDVGKLVKWKQSGRLMERVRKTWKNRGGNNWPHDKEAVKIGLKRKQSGHAIVRG